MRITFVLPTVGLSGGIRVVAIYAKALVDMGHDVVLVSIPRRPHTFKKKIKSLIQTLKLPTAAALGSHVDGLSLNHRVIDASRPIVDSDLPDADVVIATWWETAEWVNALGPSKGAKVYFVQHHEVFEHLPFERCRATYKMPLHKITIAKWLVDVLRDDYGDTDVELVPNSVDHNLFYAPLRSRQPQPTVGFLFSNAAFKGVDVTLEAIAKVRLSYPQLRVLCFGSEAPHIQGVLPSNIEFRLSPPQDSIREIYAACDVWVTASRSEGFNLPAMEAMACRTPVVSTKAGWPAEGVIDGLNGVLTEVDDVGGIVAGIDWVLGLPDEAWKDVSENAFRTVAATSWDQSSKLFEAALQRVVDKRNSRQAH